jgi:hypothetical protein
LIARPHRRSLLGQLALLGVGGAAFLGLRNHLAWPEPEVAIRGSGPGTGWLPLSGRSRLVDLPAKIKGVWIRVVVDSGAQFSAIDSDLSLRLRLPSATPIPLVAFGVSGEPSVGRSVEVDLQVGEEGQLRLAKLRAATLNLRPLSGLTQQPFSMLLGRDFLRAVIADIDFPRRRIAFYRPQEWRPFESSRPAPVRSRAGALMTQVVIEAAPPIEVMVDTGATGSLALSEETARAAGLLSGRPVTAARSITLGGVSQDRLVEAELVRFAGEVFRNVDVQIYDPSLKGAIPDGLLGVGLLGRYRVGLDLASGRMLLGKAAPAGGRA